MPRRGIAIKVAFGALLGALTAWAPDALAQDCAPKPVHAKGGYGLLEATAKSRARTAWIKKVRGSKKLGRDYAAWLRAQQASYACHKHHKRISCIASAIPCRVAPRT